MTKIDGLNNRYEMVKVQGQVPAGYVATYLNNDTKSVIAIPKDKWDKWQEVADSQVKQEKLF